MRYTIAAALMIACHVEESHVPVDQAVVVDGAVSSDVDPHELTQAFYASGAQFGVVVDPATGDVATLQNLERTVNSGDFVTAGSAACLDCGGVNSSCVGPAGFGRSIATPLERVAGSGPVGIEYVGLRNWTPMLEVCNGATCPDPTVGPGDAFDVLMGGMMGTCTAFSVFFDTVDTTPPTVHPLQNATASFSQVISGSWNASEMIDGDLGGSNGWAIADTSGGNYPAQTAVFETVSDTPAYPTGTEVTVDIINNYVPSQHILSCFRLSVTTADRSQFADGLQTGGDLGDDAIWSPLAIFDVASTSPGQTATITGNRVLMSSPVNDQTDITVRGDTSLTGITGLRLETCKDPSLPFNGPGIASNGNFVVTELQFATRAQ